MRLFADCLPCKMRTRLCGHLQSRKAKRFPASQPSNKLRACTCRFKLPISSARHILISTSVPFSQGGNAKINGLLKCLCRNAKDAQPIKHAFYSQSLRVRGNAGWQVEFPVSRCKDRSFVYTADRARISFTVVDSASKRRLSGGRTLRLVSDRNQSERFNVAGDIRGR